MATNILMPALSPTMTEGTLARWLKKEGEAVKAGDVIAEIETDKATMEFEAVDEGVLGKILVQDGTEGVKVNDPIGILVEEGEAVPSGDAPKAAPKQAATPESKPAAPEQPKAAPAQESKPAPAAQASGDRVFASPLAKRMAQQAGIDLSGIKGSGPNGRIVKADVEGASSAPKPAAQPQAAAPSTQPQAAAPAPAPKAPAPTITAPHTAVPNSSMRKVIARRLSESKSTVPHFYVTMDIEIDALLKLRADLNARAPKEGPGAFKLSVNDLVIKAAARVLRQYPNVNASWTDDAIIQYHDVDISVAVSIPDGLITPIIRKADQKGLAAISSEMKDLASRAKAGKLKPEEFQGGGFSISNMGMFGVKDFSAIINPPQAGILAVSAGEQRPMVKNGALAIATVMTCTLSVDHRVVDGALAAEFIAAFKKVVEDPLSLML
ncbi:pyruvate dehydrogenase complex dihydrolipoamide acetyltransferase [Pseudoroseomonas wenyumeiae]|uniref:Acetyltransferase component of pyruvate dehydrogenase complex n=1 Tax=Teichococcus wenyumeiae TaxID=2478470 RepID=A0A3A9JI84_9PROT|nr:pyruvate dehydrogenase complex dihydrolipoamide acetyltransferase [Pseudoroseomonas wenyumeiae]RKK06130.1 pyruvate dehydrogenase complex dihydrolipoamide acetyltransferase [Pseudoroseomonas wenyumeiae]RMI25619.1 pyruvate dehydrogenase complex dihydrolipoamide acetyltransferase [Pseudoroseomonas wenyumeiae]